jgi:hypothetical protein
MIPPVDETLGDFPKPDVVLGDPAASDWLKAAITTSLKRDPVDALNDALALAEVLEGHLRERFQLEDR